MGGAITACEQAALEPRLDLHAAFDHGPMAGGAAPS